MSIRWYRTFLAVARHGSFASAAQEIGLTQAAVSVHMRSLEDQLRLKLFDRGARTAVLNTAGRGLVARAQALVDLYDGMGGRLEDQSLGGLLALGAIPPTFSQLLPDALLALRRTHPRIAVRVSNGVSSELFRKVEQGELDAAIVSEAPFEFASGIRWQTLVTEPLVLVAPAAARFRTLAEALRDWPFIGITRSSWSGQLTHQLLRRHRQKIDEVMELDSLEAIAAMVARGFGVALLPYSAYLRMHGDALRIALLAGPQPGRRIGLVWREGKGDPALVAALRDSLMAVKPERPARLRRIPLA